MSIFNPGNKDSHYNPLWINDKDGCQLPRQRREINAWCRSFYTLNPDVHRIFNQHTLILTGCFDWERCQIEHINQFYQKQLEQIDISNLLYDLIREYFVIGEVFLFAEIDNDKKMWKRILIQNPDYIITKSSAVKDEIIFQLRPDENLRRICFSSEEEDIKKAEQLSKEIIEKIRSGQNIDLDSFHMSHLARRASTYEIRGASLLVSLFRILMKTQMTAEDNITIKQSLWDIEAANGKNIAKEVLLQRYYQIITMIEHWLDNKIQIPILKMNGFDLTNIPRAKFDRTKLRTLIVKM